VPRGAHLGEEVVGLAEVAVLAALVAMGPGKLGSKLLDRSDSTARSGFLDEHRCSRQGRLDLGQWVVLAYFPAERLPVRVRLLLEEMFDERA
jgi:hypothetical protein